MKDRHIRVNAKYVTMLAPFMSKNDPRYCLGGIYIAPHPKGGVILVASNGHQLAMVHDADGEANSAYINAIPSSILAACKCSKSAKKNQLTAPSMVHFIGDMVAVTSEAFNSDGSAYDASKVGKYHLAIMYGPAIDATYPDFIRKIPPMPAKDALSSTRVFDPALIAAFKTARDIGGNKNAGISVIFSGPHDGALVFIAGIPEFIGVLMPRRGDVPETLPLWITDLK